MGDHFILHEPLKIFQLLAEQTHLPSTTIVIDRFSRTKISEPLGAYFSLMYITSHIGDSEKHSDEERGVCRFFMSVC